MNVSLSAAHVKRLVILVASLQRVAQGDLATRAGNAVKWLEDALADAPTEDTLQAKVNSLRPEWQAFPRFDASELHHFRFHADDFARLKDDDWQMMRDFLAYRPRGKEKLFQVERRDYFLKSPKETLMNAKSWARANRKTSGLHTLQAVKNAESGSGSYPSDADVKSLVSELFREFHEPDRQ